MRGLENKTKQNEKKHRTELKCRKKGTLFAVYRNVTSVTLPYAVRPGCNEYSNIPIYLLLFEIKGITIANRLASFIRSFIILVQFFFIYLQRVTIAS